MVMEFENLIEEAEFAWTAEVRLKGNQIVVIWWTCWQSIKHIVAEVLWIASDLPKERGKHETITGTHIP
jgi:hypothetical protein